MSRSPAPQEGPTAPQRPIAKVMGDAAWVDRVLAGKYAVEGVLGRGGMGLVLKARHLRLDELVAIKVLHSSLLHDDTMAARMLREARAALRLSSEHIVRVMDVDTLENGVPFMVMEYLEGTDVSTLVRKHGGKLPWEQAVALADQTCRALCEAHALDIIHRDLKPANLFVVLRPDGRRIVKLLDFGISKVNVPREAPITKQGDILGSPRYMSPEQVRGDPLDGRADLWSVGVVLYELLAGKPPFSGDNFAVACRRVLDNDPEPLAPLRPDVPPGLCAVIDRCLQKDRERRFPDALALRDALAPFGSLVARTGSLGSLPDLGTWDGSPTSSGAVSVVPPSGVRSAITSPSGVRSAITSPSSASPAVTSPSSAPPAITSPSSAPPAIVSSPSLSLPSTPPPDGSPVTTDPTITAWATPAPQKSRAFLGVAIAGLVAGLAAGVVVLLREPTASPPSASAAAPSTPLAAGTAQPASQPEPPALPATETPAAASGAPTSAPSAAATSAHDEPSLDKPSPTGPAKAPPPRASQPRTTTTPAAKPGATSVDPFGERRK